MTATIYLEGGGDAKDLHARCREGFRKLLENCGFSGRMPKLVACGGRNATYDDFKTAHKSRQSGDYVAMLVDSEDPVATVDRTWDHLTSRDGWAKPQGAEDEQVLFMTTCMETWIVADRAALAQHYGSRLQESALPPLVKLEQRARHSVHDQLAKATGKCTNAYQKGKRSFEILAKLAPSTLEQHLPSFHRAKSVLKKSLK